LPVIRRAERAVAGSGFLTVRAFHPTGKPAECRGQGTAFEGVITIIETGGHADYQGEALGGVEGQFPETIDSGLIEIDDG
jgi:hypothetical protein